MIRDALDASQAAHVEAFELVFYLSAGIGLVGAVCCLVLVRKSDRVSGRFSGAAPAGSTPRSRPRRGSPDTRRLMQT